MEFWARRAALVRNCFSGWRGLVSLRGHALYSHAAVEGTIDAGACDRVLGVEFPDDESDWADAATDHTGSQLMVFGVTVHDLSFWGCGTGYVDVVCSDDSEADCVGGVGGGWAGGVCERRAGVSNGRFGIHIGLDIGVFDAVLLSDHTDLGGGA